jgi:hypothetical protein
MINVGYLFLCVDMIDGGKDREKFYCWVCGDHAGRHFGRFLRKLYTKLTVSLATIIYTA